MEGSQAEGYDPNQAWISKRRDDGSLVSDFVCFIDDQRLATGSGERIRAAGHTLSSHESYLGIQVHSENYEVLMVRWLQELGPEW